MELLQVAKGMLKEMATDIVTARAEELLFDQAEYENLYCDLGELCYKIDTTSTMNHLIANLITNEYGEHLIGINGNCDDDVMNFLEGVRFTVQLRREAKARRAMY